uniref:Uncharacterized protein n=1 Tax=Vespula pensylvanica TaxID=30213 RepID=A0A834NWS3_VESPE|nr:hypothetical protein H0235_010149 [Vespula pensylvanica]
MEKEDKRKRAEGTDREGEDSDGGKRVERERKKEVKEVKFQETQTGSPERRPMALLRRSYVDEVLRRTGCFFGKWTHAMNKDLKSVGTDESDLIVDFLKQRGRRHSNESQNEVDDLEMKKCERMRSYRHFDRQRIYEHAANVPLYIDIKILLPEVY